MSAPDELEALRSLRAEVGVLDATIDLRIRARIAEGLAAAPGAPALGASAPVVRDAPAEPDEFGLYEFDPTPSEADQRSDTPATLQPPRRRQGRPGHRRAGDGLPPRDATSDATSDDAWDIEVQTARHPDRSVHRRRPTRSGGARALRVIAVAAALVLLVAGGTAIIRTRQGAPDDRGTGGAVDAAAAPLTVADLAARQRQLPSVQLAPGTYQYTDIVEGRREDQVDATGSTPLFSSQRNQRWVDRDGNGREVAGPASVRPFGDPSAPPQDVGRSFDLPLRLPRAFGGFTYDELQGLPTDPDALRQQLLTGNEITSADVPGLARLAGRLLELPATPPAVRAALVTMLERDGLRSVGDRTDRLGRRGSGFELDADGHRWTYIVDRATGRLLAREERVLGSELVEGDSLVQPSAIPAVTTETGGG